MEDAVWTGCPIGCGWVMDRWKRENDRLVGSVMFPKCVDSRWGSSRFRRMLQWMGQEAGEGSVRGSWRYRPERFAQRNLYIWLRQDSNEKCGTLRATGRWGSADAASLVPCVPSHGPQSPSS